jgi:oligopeptide/dipeptide ABC transporter ATP-binding protein
MAGPGYAAAAGVLLDVRDLGVAYQGADGWIPIVDKVSLTVARGEVLGVVGESGCGKTTLALAVLRLLPNADRLHISGSVRFDGTDLLALDDKAMRRYRGARIAMIPQDPMGSLDPLFTVGAQVEESLVAHGARRSRQTRAQVLELLRKVRMDDAELRARQYPHELSGGLRQRAVGAIATAAAPDLLLADEPTTALDVTVQARYLQMLRRLQTAGGLSILFITHDLGVVATLCDRIAVMYAGRIVEVGPVDTVYAAPRHWYTKALLESVPRLADAQPRLASISGQPPRPGALRDGCRFAPRCPRAEATCRDHEPGLDGGDDGRYTRCWFPPAAGEADA